MEIHRITPAGPELSTAFATLSMSGRLVAFDWPRAGAPFKYLNR
jgi:gluconolactonase